MKDQNIIQKLCLSHAMELETVQNCIAASDELRVLVATDVLSEGQNLQGATIVVNYDLPWATGEL